MLETTNKTKISVLAWPMVAKAVSKNLRNIHVKRDSYLNSLLTQEIERLANEVDFRTPDAARFHIKKRLADLKPEPLTIVLDRTLVKRMHEVLREKNTPRNAFINRVLFFLIAKPVALDLLGIRYRKSTQTLVKPLDEAWSNLHDPFFNILDANDGEFYRLFLPDEPIAKGLPNLFGLNCVINPGTWDERDALTDAVTLFDFGAGEEMKS